MRDASGSLVCMLVFGAVLPAHGAGLIGRDGTSLAITSHRVEITIDNQIARTRVTQVFRNDSPRTLQAEYQFPLPDGAGVADFAMWTHGERRPGVMVEKARAREIYNSIVAQQRDPALLEQIDAITFRMSVYPVLPNSEQIIELTYDEVLPVEANQVRYRYPLHTAGAPGSVKQDFTLSANIRSAFAVKEVFSDSHLIDVITRPDGAVIGCEQMQAVLDRDFELRYTIDVPALSLRLAAQRDGSGDGTFMAMLAPGFTDDGAVLAKDVLLVMDTSGSMAGMKIEVAQRAMLGFVDALRDGDRFNILTFSTAVVRMSDTLVPVDAASRLAAATFIRKVQASGGTAIDEALGAALADAAQSATDAEQLRPRRVIFVTDGAPTVGEREPRAIIDNAVRRNLANARVFAFGVESASDGRLLNLLAARTGGSAERVQTGGDLELVLSDFVARIARPVFSDLSVEVHGGGVHDIYPKTVADLFQGGQVCVVGRYQQPGPATIVVRGIWQGRACELRGEVELPEITAGTSPIERLWTRRKIEYLQDEIWWRGDEPELRAEIVRLSQTGHVLTPYTSLLVLETDDDYRRFGLEPPARTATASGIAKDGSPSWFDSSAELSGRIQDTAAAPSPATAGNVGFLTGFGRRASGGPATPGGGRGPASPGGGPTSGGGGGRAAKTSRGVEGFEQWQFWWEYNRDRCLPWPARTVPVDFHPRADAVLRSVLGEDDADIVDSALLALARSARREDHVVCLADIRAALQHASAAVRRSAILSLGLLGSAEAIPTLIDIACGNTPGQVRPHAQDPELEPPLAAIALGLIGDPAASEALKDIVLHAGPGQDALQASAITALGLLRGEREASAAFLLARLADGSLEQLAQAQVPIALARLGVNAAIPRLEAMLTSTHQKNALLEQSCVIALGMLAGGDDADAIAALERAVADSNNEQARHFALIALGEIAARIGAGATADQAAGVAQRLSGVLAREVSGSRRKAHAPWAALALALANRDLPADAARRIAAIQTLGDAFDGTNNPSHKAAFALALGMLQARALAPAITSAMLDTNDLDLKAYLALTLGMLGHHEALPVLRRLLLDRRDPLVPIQVARALALLQDRAAIAPLIDALRSSTTLAALASAAQALGHLGGSAAVDSLVALIADPQVPGITRGFACVALGRIGAPAEVSWNAPIVDHANYRCVLPWLYEIADLD